MKEGEGMKILDVIVTVLLVIGALNWGILGIFGINLVGTVLGETAILTRGIYTLVGIAGLYEAISFTIGFEAVHHRWCDMPTTVKH
jgi:uncharacterized membrane protein YuzA (DUF378 family)